MTEPQIAVIEVRSELGWSYPIAERNTNGPAGWMSGAHFYPDADVASVRPMRVIPDDAPRLDPRDMHGLAIGEGVDVGNWYTYCPACSWDAGEQVGKCLEPVVAANWPEASVFVAKSSDGAS